MAWSVLGDILIRESKSWVSSAQRCPPRMVSILGVSFPERLNLRRRFSPWLGRTTRRSRLFCSNQPALATSCFERHRKPPACLLILSRVSFRCCDCEWIAPIPSRRVDPHVHRSSWYSDFRSKTKRYLGMVCWRVLGNRPLMVLVQNFDRGPPAKAVYVEFCSPEAVKFHA
ncbi:hypothetical protein FNV43_RR21872 [Rhamnella rubrinervis]|uniref:Uncharacterized protein n=1 Tax=Rhamnella rubrinervis TaxID=2594499 RepID=A0A8K0GRJ3_9ROSA|nr:hypothetical protein FNV43_RR21872 [Rhamnella rubrinervis]